MRMHLKLKIGFITLFKEEKKLYKIVKMKKKI